MSVLEIAKSRSSVRVYTDQEVEEEKLQTILEAAHVAPTAADIYGAPLAILVCVDKSKAWVRPYDGMVTADIDASILTDHMMLTAAELGLGSVWICYFKPDVLKQGLDLPDHLEPINILALGYSAEPLADRDRHSQTRIPMEELVSYR